MQDEDENGHDSTAEDGEDSDWGFSSGRQGMSKETKIGLLLVVILVGTFAFVMYKKLDKNNATLASLKQAVGLETANAEEQTPEATGDDAKQESDTDPPAGADPDPAESPSQQDEVNVAQSEPAVEQSEPAVEQSAADNEFGHPRGHSRSDKIRAKRTSSTRFGADGDLFAGSDDARQTSPEDQTATTEQSGLGAEQRGRRRFDFPRQGRSADQDDRYRQARQESSQFTAKENDRTASDLTAQTEMTQDQQDPGASQDSFNPFGDSDSTAQRSQIDSQQQSGAGLDSQDDLGRSQEFGNQAQLGNEIDSGDNSFSQNDHRHGGFREVDAGQTHAGSKTVVRRRPGRAKLWSTDDVDSQSSDDNSQSFQQPSQQATDFGGGDGQPQQQSTQDMFSGRSRSGSDIDSKHGFPREATTTGSFSASQSIDQNTSQQRSGTSNLFERRQTAHVGDIPNDPNVSVHVVQTNDNYWSISKQQYGTARYFAALERYNRGRIPDPKRMRPGMKVLVPARETLEARYPDLFPKPRTAGRSGGGTAIAAGLTPGFFHSRTGEPMYRIGTEDTLTGIAKQHMGRASRWVQVYEMNRQRLKNPNDLKIGMVLRLPSDASRVNLLPRQPGIR